VSIDNTSDEDDGEMYADSEFGDEGFSSLVPRRVSSDSDGAGARGSMRFSSFPFGTKEFCPAMMRGWGTKQGQIVKNWKRRYFTLTSNRQVTLLRYFKDEQRAPPYGDYLCGELNLQYYHLQPTERRIRLEGQEEERICHCLQLIGESALDRELLVCVEDSSEFNSWIGAIEAHMEYRREIEEMTAAARENSSSSMWSCVLL
jgi:transcription initiation factor TFIIIB Brf1 subunit/transcription initiation factor TFIIB